jgi:hypothetical protein
MEKSKLGWIAGIIDGEGCIYFKRNQIKGNRKNLSFSLTVSVVNTDLRIIKAIADFYKGGIWTKKAQGNWKEAYRLTLSSQEGYRLLKDIYPYLISKKERAWLALQLHKVHRKGRGKQNLTEKDRKLRSDIVNRISNLNGNNYQKPSYVVL